jgi:DNA-binding CsgD family transcriptional regulator
MMGAQGANALESDERRRVASATALLRALPSQGAPDAVFEAIGMCAPVAGGLVGVMDTSDLNATVSHVVKLPASVLEGWASTPIKHLHLMLAPLLGALPGQLISDSTAITGRLRDELTLLNQLRAAGLGESAGYKLATEHAVPGRSAHHFLTFALQEGQTFTRAHHAALAELLPDIRAALERLRVPLVASEPILSQIVEEQSIGYLCVSQNGGIVEVNHRAHTLVLRCLRAAGVEGGRGALDRFAQRVLQETTGARRWRLAAEGAGSTVEFTAHWLARESHALGQSLVLVMMQERDAPSALVPLESTELTPRQIEIARLLCSSGLPYKLIADRFGISEGTTRKHVENIYRCLGVNSRPELVARYR